MGLVRSRWAAVGAAVAVTLGAGGLVSVSADTAESLFVGVAPARVLDTRAAVGLDGPLVNGASEKLTVTGSVPVIDADDQVADQVVVPSGATAIVANVTAVGPDTIGFVSIRPGTATGVPSTSNINITAPGGVLPNSVTVEVAPNGTIDLFFLGTTPAATTDLLVDIVGYYVAGSGVPGPQGPTGPRGPAGADGADGADGVDAESPARVVWVADDGTGDFELLSAALASITDASSSNPYVIKIAPGVYTEPSPVALKDHVDVEGSGQGVTTITCECGGDFFDGGSATVSAGDITAELRDLTISNEGPGTRSIGVLTNAVSNGSVRLTDITATGDGGDFNYGVSNEASPSPVMTNVTAIGTGGTGSIGVINRNSSPSMDDVTASATGASSSNTGVINASLSSPSIRDSTITGSTNSISNSSATAKVANTVLDGAVAGGGFTCTGVFDDSFVALDTSCS